VNARAVNLAATSSRTARTVTGVICGYETLALALGWPTVTAFCWRHRRIAAAVSAALSGHLLLGPRV
jgi:hypothetical protein